MKSVKLFLIMFLFGFVASASAQEKSQDQLIDELIVKSGLQRQVEQIPDVMKVSIEQRMDHDVAMSAEDRYNLRAAFMEAFVPAEMLQLVKKDLTSGLSGEDIAAILVWLNSPLGQKITKIEEDTSSGKSFREMQKFAETLPDNPPEAERLNLLKELDEAAHLTECTVNMKRGVVMAMSETMAAASGQSNFSVEDVRKNLDVNRDEITFISEQETLISALYVYRSFSVEELQQYIDFYKTPAGQKYMRTTSDALVNALSQSSRKAGEKLGVLIKQKKAMSQ